MTEETETTSAGSRNYFVYVPDTVKNGSVKNPGALVMLHGCLQSASLIAAGTRLNEFADKMGFVAIYPEQTSRDNSQSCWNWYSPEDLGRSGEAEIIAAIAISATKKYALDSSRIYVAGMSAGAAMASNLLACYRDVFAGGAIHSGLAYDAAETQSEAFMAMRSGSSRSPEASARRGYSCSAVAGSRGPAKPLKVMIIHGDQDTTVSIKNAEQNVSFFNDFNDLLDDGQINDSLHYQTQTTELPANQPGGLSATETDTFGAGNALVKFVTVHGMNHAWSGGLRGGSYTAPSGPDASRLMTDFLFSTAP